MGLVLARYNVFFVTYHDDEVEKVIKELMNMGFSIVSITKSSILREFYYLKIDGSENMEEVIEKKIKEITDCWVKVEHVR